MFPDNAQFGKHLIVAIKERVRKIMADTEQMASWDEIGGAEFAREQYVTNRRHFHKQWPRIRNGRLDADEVRYWRDVADDNAWTMVDSILHRRRQRDRT